jgi:hypothetical protein
MSIALHSGRRAGTLPARPTRLVGPNLQRVCAITNRGTDDLRRTLVAASHPEVHGGEHTTTIASELALNYERGQSRVRLTVVLGTGALV